MEGRIGQSWKEGRNDGWMDGWREGRKNEGKERKVQ